MNMLSMHLTDFDVHPWVGWQKGDGAVGQPLHVPLDAVQQVAVVVAGGIAPVGLGVYVPHLCDVYL